MPDDTPATYPGQEPEQLPFIVRPYLQTARPGDELMLIEPTGRRLLASVQQVDTCSIVVTCRSERSFKEREPRGFAMNGFELGCAVPAELTALPEDWADRLRRREAMYQILAMISEHADDVADLEALREFVRAARRHRRGRMHEEALKIKALTDARKEPDQVQTSPAPRFRSLSNLDPTELARLRAMQGGRPEQLPGNQT